MVKVVAGPCDIYQAALTARFPRRVLQHVFLNHLTGNEVRNNDVDPQSLGSANNAIMEAQ